MPNNFLHMVGSQQMLNWAELLVAKKVKQTSQVDEEVHF